MKFAMCNEFCHGMRLEQVCDLAADAGYDGIEFTPFTLGPNPQAISAHQRQHIRRELHRRGLVCVGLHWLLARTEGLHICHPDNGVFTRTLLYYEQLIQLCAELGGRRMIHGSPKQRGPIEGQSGHHAWQRAVQFFHEAAPIAAKHGITLCIEPLPPSEASFITTKDQAMRLIEQVGHPNLRLVLDGKAMASEAKPPAQLIREAGPYLKHVHANDPNLSYPGSGELDYQPIMQALREIGYRDWVSVEVVDSRRSPEEIARQGIATLRQALEGAAVR